MSIETRAAVGPDHVGYFDPFAAVASAAAATEGLRVGTLVLNVEFWNRYCWPGPL